MDIRKEEPSVAVITLTNNGYIAYTLNCLRSLRRVGYREKIKVYAIGKTAYGLFRRRGYDVTLIEDERGERFEHFRQGNWANVTYYKFEIIYKELGENDFVLFTDGDVVFKKSGFLDYCIEHVGSNDMLIQNDKIKDNDDGTLCSGFMFIRSNQATRSFFHPDKVKSEIRVGWDDQVYVNERKSDIKYEKLPLAEFPNGRYFRSRKEDIDPYIIHFNWVVGHKKAYDLLAHREFQSLSDMLRLFVLARDTILQKLAERLRLRQA